MKLDLFCLVAAFVNILLATGGVYASNWWQVYLNSGAVILTLAIFIRNGERK